MKIELEQFCGMCTCGKEHEIEIRSLYIESGATKHLEHILKKYACPVFVCDENTKKATKNVLKSYYEKSAVITLKAENLHADNENVELIQNRIVPDCDIMIAVGSGTIHDLTRYVAYEKDIPFVSFPTAASVDGFVSTVAAMTWNGMKKSFIAKSPLYVVADTDIIAKAPYRLTASGISDLLGKYTALADWKISHMLTGEYLCERIYDMEMQAVREVEAALDSIRAGEKTGIEKLMYALILSGLAMQMIGNSRPASGAEHHISHLWEMHMINPEVEAYHGEKVSVGLVMALQVYENICKAIRMGKCHATENREIEKVLIQTHIINQDIYREFEEENEENALQKIAPQKLENMLPQIAEVLAELPTAEAMKKMLKEAGCVTEMEEIGVKADKNLSLCLSPYVRKRLTVMRLMKMLTIYEEYRMKYESSDC